MLSFLIMLVHIYGWITLPTDSGKDLDPYIYTCYISSNARFIAIRKRPSVIYLNNGGNFVGTENYLKALDWNRMEDEETVVCRIKRKRESASCSLVRRVVRTPHIIKQLLRKELGRASVKPLQIHDS